MEAVLELLEMAAKELDSMAKSEAAEEVREVIISLKAGEAGGEMEVEAEPEGYQGGE